VCVCVCVEKAEVYSVWAETRVPAAAVQVVFDGVVVYAVERPAVLQGRLLDAVHVDADHQAHLGLDILTKGEEHTKQQKCQSHSK